MQHLNIEIFQQMELKREVNADIKKRSSLYLKQKAKEYPTHENNTSGGAFHRMFVCQYTFSCFP